VTRAAIVGVTAGVTLFTLLLVPARVAGTPYAATWYRETLLGENGSHYFVLATRMVNEGTYYRSRETQIVFRFDKRSGAIADSVRVRSVEFHVDDGTNALSVHEEGGTTFDLAGYLRAHATHAPYSEESEFMAELDSTGLYVESDNRRQVVVPMATIRARFLPSREPEELALLGAEFTMARPDSGLGRMTYYRVRSYPAGSDASSSEVLVMVPEERVKAAPPTFPR